MVFVARCPARAALAGNPSDGYDGFVVSVPVTSVAATVTIEPATRFEIVHSPTPDDTFDDLAALIDHVDRFGMDDSRRLVLASLRTLARRTTAEPAPARISVTTTIPRSVGLAGSSAIVIATLRALAAANPSTPWAHRLRNSPHDLAELALSAERDELGIAAGFQDRLVQSYGIALAMDFSGPSPQCVPLGDLPGQVFVAWKSSGAEPSGVVHGSLRTRYDDDVGTTRATMAAIAEQGHIAATAIGNRDVAALGTAIDRTLELRAQLMPLDEELLAVASTVRELGGHANWTGSGGAIAVLVASPEHRTETEAVLRREHGCQIIDV